MTKELVLEFLADGGSISIVRSNKDDRQLFYLTTEENYFDSEEKSEKFKTFVQAFKELDIRYKWYYLTLGSVADRYKEIIRIKLLAHRKKSDFSEESFLNVKHSYDSVQ